LTKKVFITEDTGGKRQTHYNIRTRVKKNGKRKKRIRKQKAGKNGKRKNGRQTCKHTKKQNHHLKQERNQKQ
ncbi:hypothetical protein AAH051_21660, partial [Phocaeicola dorei]|uniref:hypothetical protein n=1 Tax=Phocaeicola dorei TaxID=357276 RepID=UPI0039B5028E